MSENVWDTLDRDYEGVIQSTRFHPIFDMWVSVPSILTPRLNWYCFTCEGFLPTTHKGNGVSLRKYVTGLF